MSELSYLHISDAHFPDSTGDSYELDKVTKSLLNTLKSFYKKGNTIDLIFFTGDLAYSGKGYNKASLFFEELLKATGLDKKLNERAKERLFIVPGNHDVYRKETGYVQRTLDSTHEANDFFQPNTADNRKAHFKRFKYFSKFYNNFFSGLRSYTAAKHWFAEKITLAMDDKELLVGVVGFNTAWFSRDDKDQNKLWIGERTCRTAYDHLYKDIRPDIVFTLHHHPFEWLHPSDRKEVQGLITFHSDFDLSGHLHEASTEQVSSSYGHVLRFQAGALFDTDMHVKRAFIGKIDLDNGEVHITPISYESNPHDLWTIDTALYPDMPDYIGKFRLSKNINLHKRDSPLSESTLILTAEKLAPYYERLRARIESVKIDRFIDLGLSISKSHRARWSSLRHRGEPLRTFNIFELADMFPTQRIAIVGDPGSGKTTLLTELVKRYINYDKLIPVFIPMGMYSERDMIDFFDLKELSRQAVEELLDRGRFLIVFDGVNESPADSLDDVFHSITKFIKKYPSNRYFLSCRTSEFPDWVHEDLTEVTILPVSMDEIEHQFLAVLGDFKGREIMNRISLEQGYTRLKELCQNPLLLAMLLTIYKGTLEDDPGRITSRARLYEKFLQRMEHRERKKRKPRVEERTLPSGLREEILSLIGFKMQEKELVYVVEETLQRWLVEAIDSGQWDTWWRPGERPTLQTLFRNAVGKPPIKAIGNEEDPKYFAFLHQSFGEYYSALYLKNSLDSDRLELSDLDLFILDATRRQWEVITLLCGLLDDAEQITSYIKHKAEELRNQSLLVLAGHCVRDASHIPSEEADDVRIRLIDAFKYWDIPFDYELIHAIKETMGRQSSLFPHRLAEDALRFAEKYAQVIPVELKETSIESLKRYLFCEDSSLVIDSAYTLANRTYRSESEKREVTGFILARLESSTTGIVREQLIMALKMLADPVSLPTLLRLIADTGESPRARAFALNGLGQIGDLSATQPIIDYLLNHQNPYRDSASWSLQMLGKIAMSKAPELAEHLKNVYMQALLRETDDIEGRYAKGNIIYSLGIMQATEFTDQILEWILTQKDDYVLEDAINAIGNLGDYRASNILISFITWNDPVVRMKAANALGEIGYCEAIPDLENLLGDHFPIVRETAKKAIDKLVLSSHSSPGVTPQ